MTDRMQLFLRTALLFLKIKTIKNLHLFCELVHYRVKFLSVE